MCGCRCGCGQERVPEGKDSAARFVGAWLEPTKAERKEAVEAFKKRLEEKLADVDEELRKL
jgi:hypothetical protein